MGLVRPRFDPFEIRFDPKNNSFGSNQIYRKFSVQRGLQHTGFSVTSKMIERVLGTRWREIDRERECHRPKNPKANMITHRLRSGLLVLMIYATRIAQLFKSLSLHRGCIWPVTSCIAFIETYRNNRTLWPVSWPGRDLSVFKAAYFRSHPPPQVPPILPEDEVLTLVEIRWTCDLIYAHKWRK